MLYLPDPFSTFHYLQLLTERVYQANSSAHAQVGNKQGSNMHDFSNIRSTDFHTKTSVKATYFTWTLVFGSETSVDAEVKRADSTRCVGTRYCLPAYHLFAQTHVETMQLRHPTVCLSFGRVLLLHCQR